MSEKLNRGTLSDGLRRWFWSVGACQILFFAKFLIFDVIWCCSSSFSSFSYPTTYLSKILLALLFTLPLLWRRTPRWTVVVIALAVDAFLISNLAYFRTYYTVIPLDSYKLAGNLKGRVGIALDMLRWCDLLFLLTTLAAGFALYCRRHVEIDRRTVRGSLLALLVSCAAVVGLMLSHGGFRKSYGGMLVHRQMSATPTYSIFGTLLYEATDSVPEMTPELVAEIDDFLKESADGDRFEGRFEVPRTVVVMFLESFESWVLEREVEGVEITPNLNRLLRDSTTLYASKVATQVKGGRSIDAQLLITAGLLPITDGSFSSRYPYSTYHTLVKAVREYDPELRACAFTPDKRTSWNQMIVVPQFGFDEFYSRTDFSRDSLTGHGNHKRQADGPFLEECLDKVTAIGRETDSRLYLQFLTYSGHSPFVIPDELKRVHFSERIPRRMNDYITAANYTDWAVGRFVDGLRSDPRFADAVIVITGDHEGLGTDRAGLAADRAGAGVVSAGGYTPLIVLNSPVGLRYDGIMGQIDIYPTLLDLLGLQDWHWRGLGRSILRDDAPRAAVSPWGSVEGSADEAAIERLRRAWHWSDVIIRGDYFGAKTAQ